MVSHYQRLWNHGFTIIDLEGLNPRFFSFGPSQNSKHSWRLGGKELRQILPATETKLAKAPNKKK